MNNTDNAIVDIEASEIPNTQQSTHSIALDIIGTTLTNAQQSDLKKHIIQTYVQPAYIRDIKDSLSGRYKWRKISDRMMGLSKFLIIISGIFAFAGAKFTELWWLSFLAGSLNILTTSLFHYAAYANQESKLCTEDANEMLTSLGISAIPNIEENNAVEFHQNT